MSGTPLVLDEGPLSCTFVDTVEVFAEIARRREDGREGTDLDFFRWRFPEDDEHTRQAKYFFAVLRELRERRDTSAARPSAAEIAAEQRAADAELLP